MRAPQQIDIDALPIPGRARPFDVRVVYVVPDCKHPKNGIVKTMASTREVAFELAARGWRTHLGLRCGIVIPAEAELKAIKL
jgi:hypothetical protein